jgi:hypothetical protein
MDPSGFNTGRAVAVPLVPRQGVVFGKAAAAGKPGAGTAEGKVVAGSGPATGAGPSRHALKGARPGAHVYNAETEQNVNNRKPSPTRVRKAAPVAAHPPIKQNPGGITFSDVELQRLVIPVDQVTVNSYTLKKINGVSSFSFLRIPQFFFVLDVFILQLCI